jgi:hypothetical protein
MSEAESTGDPVEVMADIGEAEAEEVEGEMEAVDQIEGDTADVQEDVAKLAGATESLEGCVAILDAAAQRGGLDVFASSFLRNNVGTVTRSLKLKPLLLPALEDMETPSAKIAGANNAKDQIVAFINRIIDTIKQGFDRLSTWIIETYKRLTNAFVAIERRAEKLKERISAATMKEGELDNAKLAGAMLVYGEASTGLDVATTVKDMGELAKFMNDPKSYKDYLTALDLCEELVKSPEKEDEIRGKISQTLKSFSSGFSNHAVNISRALVKTADKTEDGSTSTFALGLFGNQEVRITLPTSADGIRSLRATVQAANEVSGANKKVTAADQKAALKICEQVAATAKVAREAAEANKGGVKELIEEIKKRKDIVMGQAKVAADAEDGAADRLRKVMAYVSGFFASTPGLPVHGINRALPRNLGIALDYVAASIAGAAPAEGAAA